MLPLLVATALAAVPVRLPTGVDSTDWLKPLQLAGLEVAPLGAGPSVELIDEGSRWRIRVRDRTGMLRETTVSEPATPQAREDVAWLAASLLKPTTSGSTSLPAAPTPGMLPPPPAVATTPSRPRPAAEPAAMRVVATPAAPEVPEIIPSAPVPPPTVAGIEEEPPILVAQPEAPVVALDLAVGTGVGWRPGLDVASATWLRAGPRLFDVLVLGAEASLSTRATIQAYGEGHAVLDVDSLIGAWYVGQTRLPLRAGLGAGVAWRTYTDGDFQTDGVVPIVGAELGVDLHFGRWIRLGPTVATRVDLRGTRLTEGGESPTSLTPVSLRGGLSLAFGPQSGDPSFLYPAHPR